MYIYVIYVYKVIYEEVSDRLLSIHIEGNPSFLTELSTLKTRISPYRHDLTFILSMCLIALRA